MQELRGVQCTAGTSRLFTLIQAFLTTPHGAGRVSCPPRRMAHPPHPPSPAALRHLSASDAIGLVVCAAARPRPASACRWRRPDRSRVGARPAPARGRAWSSGSCCSTSAATARSSARQANVSSGTSPDLCALIPFGIWATSIGGTTDGPAGRIWIPTTATLAPQPRSPLQRHVVSVCWTCWVPVFSLVYRLGNFWSPRLHRGSSATRRSADGRSRSARRRRRSWVVLWQIGPLELARIAGVGNAARPGRRRRVIISQHTHVPMELSDGQRVLPHRRARPGAIHTLASPASILSRWRSTSTPTSCTTCTLRTRLSASEDPVSTGERGGVVALGHRRPLDSRRSAPLPEPRPDRVRPVTPMELDPDSLRGIPHYSLLPRGRGPGRVAWRAGVAPIRNSR